MAINNDELYRGQEEIKEKLDHLNGRLRETERQQAEHEGFLKGVRLVSVLSGLAGLTGIIVGVFT